MTRNFETTPKVMAFLDFIREADPVLLSKCVTGLNIIVAAMVSISGILSLVVIVDLVDCILGLYALLFGLLLVLFHLRIGIITRWMLTHFGES